MSKAEWDTEYGLLGSAPPVYDFGINNAVVRAAFDDTRVYFLVEWSDATENKARDQLTLVDGGWVRSTDNEDRLYFAFEINGSFPGFAAVGCAAACHVKERLGDVTTTGRSYRFRMHTDVAGELADVWSWRATTTNPVGYADDNYWDETGRKADALVDFVFSNRVTVDGGTVPLYMNAAGVNTGPAPIFSADAGLTPLAIAFNGDGADAGTQLPGYVYQRASPGRDDVRAVGRWRNGKWTVELSRALVNSDPKDVQFLPLQ
jgi:hypothetical protein